ncbi:MAG: hypothetical protein ACTSQJ_04095 [Promethearchaeota archaeon]
MSRTNKIKERIKNFQVGTYFLLIFLISLLLCIYIPRYIIKGSFKIGVNVNYTNETQYFTIEWSNFLQIICLGPVFGVIFYILMRSMLNKVDKNQGKNKYYLYLIEICVLLLIIFNSMGHLAHLSFDKVNAIDKTEGSALQSEFREIFVYAWFMDEWLGHTMIHITYFGYLILAVIVELLLSEHEKMEIDELFLVFCMGIGICIIDGYAALRSECGFVIMILHIIFAICALIVIIIKKINPLYYPILSAMLLATIFVIITNIDWILKYGVENYYPFYSSNLK